VKDGEHNKKASALAPIGKRFLWGLGGLTDKMMYSGINGLVDPIYNIAMGIDPRVLGLARVIPHVADIIINPLIGHLSDNTRTRWGRRRPWMLAGTLLSAFTAVAMWFVPQSLGRAVADAFVVIALVILFTFGYSLFTIPYNAQGYGLSTDYNERTHLFKWRQYAFTMAGLLTPWLPWLCIRLDIMWGGVTPAQANGLYGIHYVSLLVGGIILLSAAAPIFCCDEGQPAPKGEARVPLYSALRLTLRNRAFWPLLLGGFLIKLGMCSTGIFFIYLLIYHVAGGDKQAGTELWGGFCMVINVATLLAMAPVAWMTGKIGKKPAMLSLLALSAAAYASVWYTFQPHVGGQAWLLYATATAIGLFCNCLPLLMNAMLADVCDVDELACGHQRQAFYSAIFGTSDKLATGVALLTQGFLLTASGFDPCAVTQKGETIGFWLKALLIGQPAGFIAGFIIILAYPLTRAKALEISAQLASRKLGA
jgi:GPH family glycoside/pentoside/hexuronide:cation symporter